MKIQKEFFAILIAALFGTASVRPACGIDLGGALKKAQQKADNVKGDVDKAVGKAQNGVNKAQETVGQVQDSVDRGKEQVDNAARKYTEFKQTVVDVKAQAKAVVADPSQITDFLVGAANLDDAIESARPQAESNAAEAPSPLDALLPADAGPTMKITRQAVLRGLPIQLGNYAFDTQVLQAAVTIGDAARGVGCVPQLLDDANLSTWLRDHRTPGLNFDFAFVCPSDKLGTYSAAAQARNLVADVACDLLEITPSGGAKFLMVRPTQVAVRFMESPDTSSHAGVASGK